MQPRLQRYKQFIDTQFIDSLLWNKDYSLDGLGKDLRSKIETGQFRKIIFHSSFYQLCRLFFGYLL